MIERSGFHRLTLSVLSVAAGVVLSAACGGKVDSSSTGSGSGGSSNAGASGNSDDCSGQPPIRCPACPGEPPTPVACVNGVRECATTKCVVQTCSDAPEPDCKCGTPSCAADGAWECPSSCTCPADLGGLDGAKCDVEGLSCGGENCSNPCNFCNILQCTGGVWTSLEAFPEPCDDGGPITVDAGVGH